MCRLSPLPRVASAEAPGSCAQQLYAEIAIHRSLSAGGGHPNVLNFIEWFEDEDNVYMILDLCKNRVSASCRAPRARRVRVRRRQTQTRDSQRLGNAAQVCAGT